MNPQDEKVPAAVDFERLFVDEPTMADPADDLRRGRHRRGRRRVVTGVVAAIAAVAIGGTVTVAVGGRPALLGPAGPSALPAPPVTPAPSPSSTPSSQPTQSQGDTPRDTAPALRHDAKGSYLDAKGHSLGGSIMNRDPNVHPFQATTKNSWSLAKRHLDPSGDHLAGYEAFAFSGGGSEGGLQIGQKLGWTTKGDPGEGMIQLAVTRARPGKTLSLGSGKVDADGFCNDLYLTDTTCRRTTVAGVEVYVAQTPDGGFVMDRRQDDGEVASIIVSPVFGNNTDVALTNMGIKRAAAASLLDDPALDVIG